MGIIKIKNFCYVKDSVKRLERQITDWKKKYANHILKNNQNLEYIENTQNTTVKRNSQIKNWAKHMYRHFNKENIQMANKHMKIV